jgi:hypothetical protein
LFYSVTGGFKVDSYLTFKSNRFGTDATAVVVTMIEAPWVLFSHPHDML